MKANPTSTSNLNAKLNAKLIKCLKDSRKKQSLFIEKTNNSYLISNGNFIIYCDDPKVIADTNLCPMLPTRLGTVYEFRPNSKEPNKPRNHKLTTFLTNADPGQSMIHLPFIYLHKNLTLEMYLQNDNKSITFINRDFINDIPENTEFYQQNQKSPVFVRLNGEPYAVFMPIAINEFPYQINVSDSISSSTQQTKTA